MLPTIREHQAEHTKYIAMNPLSDSAFPAKAARAGGYSAYLDAMASGEPLFFEAQLRHVCELASLCVDLDFYKAMPNASANYAMAMVLDLADDGHLPTPSLFTFSGRGLYCWWLLSDAAGHPPMADESNTSQWRQIMAELLKRLAGLEPDHRQAHPVGWRKFAGETDPKSGNRVRYVCLAEDNEDGRPEIPRYQLNDLTQALELQIPPVQAPPEARPTPTDDEIKDAIERIKAKERTGPGRRGNPAATAIKRADEIVLLATHRGGFVSGYRHSALWHYFNATKARLTIQYQDDGMDRAAAVNEAWRDAVSMTHSFNGRWCTPPKPSNEVAKACSAMKGNKKTRSGSASPHYSVRNDTIARDLGVTIDETHALGLSSLAEPGVRKLRADERARKQRRKKALQREIDRLLLAGHSVRRISADLEQRYGRPVARSTIGSRRRKLVESGQLPSSSSLQASLLE